jgi:SPP1 family predicted phage head-tail adaptor
MRAGQLRDRVLVDEPYTAQNSVGEITTTWRTRGAVWAAVMPLSGREILLAQQLTALVDTRIRMRWSPKVDGITPQWRLRMGLTVYNILSVLPQGKAHEEIECMCRSGANEG